MIITVNKIPLDLPEDTKLNIEINSPIFSGDSSMSLPISIPLTNKNRRTLDLPDDLTKYDYEMDGYRTISDIPVFVTQNNWEQKANMKISGLSENGLEATIYFTESNIYSKLESMTLPEAMAGLHEGAIPPAGANLDTYRQNLFNSLQAELRGYQSYAGMTTRGSGISYQQWRNMQRTRAAFFKTKDYLIAPAFCANGWLNLVENTDPFYLLDRGQDKMYVTAFLRLDFVLHRIFEKMGTSLTIDFDSYPEETGHSSFFEEQWHSIVVLNNTIDALYPGCMYYSTLVPQITCKDFLTAVIAQFGCAFSHQQDGSFKMSFLKETLSHPEGKGLLEYRDLQVAYNSSLDKDISGDLEKITLLDSYPADSARRVATLKLEGACQRTTTTSTDGEDSTLSDKCPLAFGKLEYYCQYQLDSYGNQQLFYTLLSQGIEFFNHEECQDSSNIEPYLYYENFAVNEGLFIKNNKTLLDILSSFDKITINQTLSTHDLNSFDFIKPLVLKGRICWPIKLQCQLSNSSYQHVTIDLIAPHHILS